jgi:hypothetical protein
VTKSTLAIQTKQRPFDAPRFPYSRRDQERCYAEPPREQGTLLLALRGLSKPGLWRTMLSLPVPLLWQGRSQTARCAEAAAHECRLLRSSATVRVVARRLLTRSSHSLSLSFILSLSLARAFSLSHTLPHTQTHSFFSFSLCLFFLSLSLSPSPSRSCSYSHAYALSGVCVCECVQRSIILPIQFA